MGIFKDVVDEVFRDLGRMHGVELEKGQKLPKGDDSVFTQVSGRVFGKIVSKIKQNDISRKIPRGLETLSVYSPKEYENMLCYVGTNNSSGYAIAHKDELVSVFSSQGSSGDAIVQNAKLHGAKRLDCFAQQDKNGKISGPLFTLYSRNGFKVDSNMNSGEDGEAYSIRNGVSYFVNDQGEVEPDNENVVIFMRL